MNDAQPTRLKLSCIYALVDPRDGQHKYIGRAVCPGLRFNAHLSDLTSVRDNPKRMWFEELVSAGLLPQMSIIAIVPRENVKKIEKKTILEYTKTTPGLLNIQNNRRRSGYSSNTPKQRVKKYSLSIPPECVSKVCDIQKRTGIKDPTIIISLAIGKMYQGERHGQQVYDYQDQGDDSSEAENASSTDGIIYDGRS